MRPKPSWLWGRHAVEETLASRRLRILSLVVDNAKKDRCADAMKAAKRAGANIRCVGRRELDRISGGGRHQGLAVQFIEKAGRRLEDLVASLSPEEKNRTLLVALDQVQDPHNFGAIARSAACLGARALLYPERRSAPLTQAVVSASAGAVQRIETLQIGNLARTLEDLKGAGFWVYGADRDGRPAWGTCMNRPMVLVVGSEGKGLRPLVRSMCDEVVAIPQAPGGVDSLNASCAASVLLYEAARQFQGGKVGGGRDA